MSIPINSTTPPETAKLFQTAWEAAHAAGTLIRKNWRQPKEIAYKGAIDLVTSVDRDAERCIVDRLRKNFPEHSILAEEETKADGDQSSYRWIIDPLDGTTNFAHGYPQVCVSVALEYENDLLLGVVYDPLRRECFSAIRSQGAKLNGQTIHVSGTPDLDQALLATGFPYDRRDHADFYLRYFKAFMTRSQGIRRAGSAALDLCYVACGRFDGFWELKLHPWDIAAASLIVRAAGGRMSDFSGGDFSIHGSETMASNGLIHAAMFDVMREIERGSSQ
ncbi:MAG TPA: inositol monophosphatase family protein [Candidatus Binatia bacterium]|nr:inositol monophosphatase family protein [Candidatus Binatia bacterium]